MSVTEAYVDKAIEASEARTDMKFERVLTEIRHLAGEVERVKDQVQGVKDQIYGVEGEMHGMREDNLRTRRAVWAGVAAIAGLIVTVVALVLTAFQAGLGV